MFARNHFSVNNNYGKSINLTPTEEGRTVDYKRLI